MAVEKTGPASGPGKADYQVLSTDTKPTAGVASGSTLWVLDLKTAWIYSENNTYTAGGNGRWPV